MFCFASCLCRVNLYGRNSMGFSGVVSLSSLSGCLSFVPSSIYVGSSVVLVFLPIGGSFVGRFSPPADTPMFTAPT